MLEFIIVVILANLVMLALLYLLRHAIAIRAPVLFITVGISIIYCILYPFLSAQMHYPRVLYLYIIMVMAGAGALYYIESRFFSARELKEEELANMTVGEALAAMGEVSVARRDGKLAAYWEGIVCKIKDLPGIRKDRESAAGVYTISVGAAADGVITGSADSQSLTYGTGNMPEEVEEPAADTAPDEPGHVLEEAAKPQDVEEVIDYIAAAEVEQDVTDYRQDDSGYEAEPGDIPEEVEEFVADTAPDELGYVIEEAANPQDAEEIIEYIEAETGEEYISGIPEDHDILTDVIDISSIDGTFFSESETGALINQEDLQNNAAIEAEPEEISVVRSGVDGETKTGYMPGIGYAEDETSLKADIESSDGDTYTEADEISILVAGAFDFLTRGDSAGAVDMFFKALKMGPPPRLAVLLCTRISSIYMAQGLKRQAVSTMEMLEVVWGPLLDENELKGIKAIIIQLRGEVL